RLRRRRLRTIECSRMRAVAFACFLACGGMVVPDPPPPPDPPGPPPPHDYQVGFARFLNAVEVWHSSTATMTQPGPYTGNPSYTHDGSLFVALTYADIN